MDLLTVLPHPLQPCYSLTRLDPGSHMIFSVSWKTWDDKFIPAHFCVSTAKTYAFYFSEKVYDALQRHGLIGEDESGFDYVLVRMQDGSVKRFGYTLSDSKDTSWIGLRFILAVGMTVDHKSWSFLRVGEFF